jgi:hypothetical protein
MSLSSYGHAIAAEPVTIFDIGNAPLLGALGSEGATAVTGREVAAEPVQSKTNGCGFRAYVYRGGGGANRPIDQLTGSGVTVSGAAEKVPVATN